MLWLAGLTAAGGMAGASGTTLDLPPDELPDRLASSAASASEALSKRRWRFGATWTAARALGVPGDVVVGLDLGGAAAIGTTPGPRLDELPGIAGGDSDAVLL